MPSRAIEDGIANLRRLMVESDDFRDIGNAFYDLTDLDGFLNLGEPSPNDKLAKMMSAGVQSLFQKSCAIAHHVFIHIPEFRFYHGPALIGPFSANIIYFEDLDKGLLMVARDMATCRTDFLRISTANVSGPAFPSTERGTD